MCHYLKRNNKTNTSTTTWSALKILILPLYIVRLEERKERDSETLASLNQVTPQTSSSPQDWLYIPNPSPECSYHISKGPPRERVRGRQHQLVLLLSLQEPLGRGFGLGGLGCVGVCPKWLGERLVYVSVPGGCACASLPPGIVCICISLPGCLGVCVPPRCVRVGTRLSCVSQEEVGGNKPSPSRGRREARAGPRAPRPASCPRPRHYPPPARSPQTLKPADPARSRPPAPAPAPGPRPSPRVRAPLTSRPHGGRPGAPG